MTYDEFIAEITKGKSTLATDKRLQTFREVNNQSNIRAFKCYFPEKLIRSLQGLIKNGWINSINNFIYLSVYNAYVDAPVMLDDCQTEYSGEPKITWTFWLPDVFARDFLECYNNDYKHYTNRSAFIRDIVFTNYTLLASRVKTRKGRSYND